MKLSADMQRVVLEQRLGFVATVTRDGRPNVSPKGTTIVWDDEHLMFADIVSPGTVENIATNPNVEVNVVDPILRKGYRFQGLAVAYSEGPMFDRGLAVLREHGSTLTPQRVRSIVVIEITAAAPLVSPAYDDGATEASIIDRWLRHYQDSPPVVDVPPSRHGVVMSRDQPHPKRLALVPTRFDPCAGPLRQALRAGDWQASYVNGLTMLVGGIDALEQLDAEPHPDETFDWSCVLDRDRAFVEAVLAATDRCCDEWLDVEYRTIVRRLLALVALHDPRPLRRSTAPIRFAAGLVWLALQGNGEVGPGGRRQAQVIWYWFDVRSSCAALGRGALAAAGLGADDELAFSDLPRGQVVLGDFEVLHSSFRARLVTRRGHAEIILEDDAHRRADSRSIVDLGNGRVRLVMRPVAVLWARRIVSSAGRAHVLIALGESEDDPELLSLSVPQAHDLRAWLQDALDAPFVQS